MKLQLRVLLIPFVTVSALVFGLHLLLEGVTNKHFSHLESEAFRKNSTRVQNSLATAVAELSSKIPDWAQWDNTYDFMESLEPTYIEQNLNSLTLGALRFRDVLYFNDDLTLRYGVTVSTAEQTETPSEATIERYRQVLKEYRSGSSKSVEGILQLEGELFLFSSAPILPNKGDKVPRGVLLATSRVDTELLTQVSELTSLKLRFWILGKDPLDSDAGDALRAVSSADLDYVREVSPELAQIYGIVRDFQGHPVLLYRIDDSRTIRNTGGKIRVVMTTFLAFTGVIALIFLVILLNFAVAKRMQALAIQLNEIAKSKDTTKRINDVSSHRKSLLYRTAGIVFGVFIVVTLILSIGFNRYLLSGFEEVEIELALRNMQRAERALESKLEKLKGKAIDWAQWDDTYNFIVDRNSSYADANLNFDTLGSMRMRYIFLISDSGMLVDGRSIEFKDEVVQPVSASMRDAIESLPQVRAHDFESVMSGFYKINDEIVMLAGSPVLNSARSQPTRGLLIFAAPVDENLIKDISDQTKLSLKFLPAFQLSSITPVVFESESEILGNTVIQDVAGKASFILQYSGNRAIYEQGVWAAKLLAWWLALGGSICALTTVGGVYRTVLVRLAVIMRQVSSIRTSGNAQSRISFSARDELGTLTDNINSMLAALEITQRELEAARDAAEEASAAKSLFVAKVSHELRTPLHGIIGMHRIAIKNETVDYKRRYLEMAQTAAENLLNIIDDILDFSKFSSGKMPLQSVEFSLRQVLQNVLLEVGPKAYEKADLEVSCIVDPRSPDRFVGDPVRLKQLFVNILGNAIKFTNEGACSLVVEVANHDSISSIMRCVVKDTGIGTASDRISAIFDPFIQADDTTSREYSGTGLGLTIVKQIVDAMDGKIDLVSQPGKGTEFHIDIPLKKIQSDRLEVLDLRGVEVVVVTDHEHVKQFFTRALTPLNSVVTSPSIEDFIEHPTRHCKNDSVLVIDGRVLEQPTLWDAFSRVASQHPSLKIIPVVAPAQMTLREHLQLIGVNSILSKPLFSDDAQSILEGQPSEPSWKQNLRSIVKAAQPLRVLVAEDVPMSQIIIRELLEEQGHFVTIVGDGEALVSALEGTISAESGLPSDGRLIFDIVLTDVQMPKLDGISAVSRIRAMEDQFGVSMSARIPIVALTANAYIDDHAKMLESGLQNVLTKPLDPVKLADAMASLVRNAPGDGPFLTSLSKVKESESFETLREAAAKCIHDCLSAKAEEQLHEAFELLVSIGQIPRGTEFRTTGDLPECLLNGLLDVQTLLQNLGGSPRLLRVVTEAFLAHYSSTRAALERVSETQDLNIIEFDVHAVKGPLLQSGARIAGALAGHVESLCHEKRLPDVLSAYPTLLFLIDLHQEITVEFVAAMAVAPTKLDLDAVYS